MILYFSGTADADFGIVAVFIRYFYKKTGCAEGVFNAALIRKNKAAA